jgi:large subunit ribosomal protein L18
VDVYSRILKRYGYLGHGGNVSSAYLTGLVAGLTARKKGIEEAVVDLGLQRTTKGSSLFAAAKGILDGGVHLNISEDILPDEKRLNGSHVAEYANKIKGSERYGKQFSLYIQRGLEPENFVQHFEEVKKKIKQDFGKSD